MLQKVLTEKISRWQDEVRSIVKEKGDVKISDVTVSQAYGGMRGIKGLTCETSAVSADKGSYHPWLSLAGYHTHFTGRSFLSFTHGEFA